MNWHPVTLALILAEVVSVVIYAAAALHLFTILPAWHVTSNDADQLSRERALETIQFQAIWVALIQALAFVLLIAGISNLWAPLVPGAMCGMGVRQALGAAGRQALLFKALTLLVFYCWYATMKIESRTPEATAVGFSSRLLLVAAPFLVLGAWSLARALAGLNSTRPVSCCAAVYDLALGPGPAVQGMAAGTMTWVLTGLLMAGAAVIWGWVLWWRPGIALKGPGSWPAVVVWAGLPVAFMVISRAAAPYILEVLWHPCPWCLLLSDHGAVGIVLFAPPAWVAAESLVVVMAGHMARRNVDLELFALGRIRQAGLGVAVVIVVWVLAAGFPAARWFVRFGDWIR